MEESAPPRSPWRAPAVAAVLIAALALWWVLGRGSDHHYKLIFADAGQLVPGDVVRVGGTKIGSVGKIGISADGMAEVSVTVSDDFGALHEGTSATIRAAGLIGVASRYLDVSPGPNFQPALSDGATIGSEHTQAIVEVDQLFNTLDADTRQGLRHVVKGFADWYQGQEANANQSARYFGPALETTTRLFNEIGADQATFRQFLTQTGTALDALTRRRGELTDLVSNTRATLGGLSADNGSLSQALKELPPALHAGSDAFVALRGGLDDLQALVDVTGPATKDLAPWLQRLAPVLDEAGPVFRDFRLMFNRPGAHDDLYEALRDLPPLADTVEETFPDAIKALDQSTPIFSFARPYVPDLVSWVGGYGAGFAPYDANGHYAHTTAVFDAFDFTDDNQGGSLSPKSPADRGRGGALRSGLLHRCPGAAAPSPADNSAPFVDDGPLANPDCDPADTPGATG
ncbi:MAG: MlaD family protein [Solirubrobacteraceae bacterium]